MTLTFTPAPGEAIRWWVLQVKSASGWTTRVQFGTKHTLVISSSAERVLVYAGDAVMNLSAPAEWRR